MKKPLMLIAVALACCLTSAAQDQDILAVILKSAEDWNRGDLQAFMRSYEDSPDTTFVGTEVARGTDAVLARYRRTYSSVAQMGKTTFSELKARPLSPDLAIVTGRYTLERAQDAGGRKTGVFTLVMRKGSVGWRIIHDHTSASN